MRIGERRGRGSGRNTELGEHVLQVACDGVLADHELDRDVAVRLARGDQTQYLGLAGGQAGGKLRRSRREGGRLGGVGGGAEVLEGRMRRLERAPRAVLVAGCAEARPNTTRVRAVS